ncbi:efflux RND transporter periplasmic adaptor subunit [Paracoccus denitrificans]|nr:efflux RND transporter periplasmic adaptor subunit [Paracoccus denitrificans]MBB4627791.1 RND family efflux transporter MFP subunit [Paracoccus denitrificans]MCU7428672.1 efflux RND transporter periplasmic adaptor subunit [Paracoccus denitrificans]UPV95296.1 efflux RND transporter periplasmic adaptor subunit [Paracoccus denitrificans]WQO32646.1 efflux RND transporter periplasmic adaptor subunit [Paracoccus denitrificans]
MQLLPREVLRVAPATIAERLTVSGEVRPVQRVILRAQSGGVVAELGAREGEAVRAGDMLVRFDTEELAATLALRQSEVEATEARLRFARQALERIERLAERTVATQEQLDQARRESAVLQAQLDGLRAQAGIARAALRDAEIRAPFDGVVASRSVDVGERASAEAELMTLVDPTRLEARVLIATRDVPRIAPGQAAELRIDGLEGETIEGSVLRINPVANDGSRFISVHIGLDDPDGRLRGGMFATGTILVEERADVLALPATALREDGDGAYVLRLAEGQIERRPVVTGAAWSGGRIEIRDGIASGDTILIAPLPGLGEGVLAEVSGG